MDFSYHISCQHRSQKMREIEDEDRNWTHQTLTISERHHTRCRREEEEIFFENMKSIMSWKVLLEILLQYDEGLQRIRLSTSERLTLTMWEYGLQCFVDYRIIVQSYNRFIVQECVGVRVVVFRRLQNYRTKDTNGHLSYGGDERNEMA